jgi:hypothetical protein
VSQQLARFTLEVWMYPTNASMSNGKVAGPLERGNNFQIQWDCTGPPFCKSVNLTGPNGPAVVSYGNAAATAWTSIAATYDGTQLAAYNDGLQASATQNNNNPPNSDQATTKIGAHGNLDAYFAGRVDEARISKVARSAAYLELQYRSMTDTLITYGAEQAAP